MQDYRIIFTMFKKIRRWFGFLIIIIAIIMLIWGVRQFPRQSKTIRVNPEEIFLSEMADSELVIPEVTFSQTPIPLQSTASGITHQEIDASSTYILVLDAPTRIHLADADYLKLSISPDGLAGTISSDLEVSDINPTENSLVIISTHNLLVETRLEMDDVLFEPTGDIITPFQPQRTLNLYWTIQPENPGVYQGIMWLHFQYVARDGSNTQRKLVSRQSFEIAAVSFGGLRGDVTRFIAIISLFIGLFLDIDLWIALFKKIKDK